MDAPAHHNSSHRFTLQNIERFPGQRAAETVRLCIRRHWLGDVVDIYLRGFFFLFILPLVAFLMWRWLHPTHISGVLIVFGFIYLLFAWLDLFIQILKDETSVVLVTNQRLLEFYLKSLFCYEVTETNLQRVQDVRGITHGIAGSFLDVGDLEVETAGQQLVFLIREVKDPQLTARSILEIQRENTAVQQYVIDATADLEEAPELPRRADDTLTNAEIMALRVNQSAQANGNSPRF